MDLLLYARAFTQALTDMRTNIPLREEWIFAMTEWEVDRDIDWTPEQTNEFLEKLNCDRFGKMLDRLAHEVQA